MKIAYLSDIYFPYVSGVVISIANFSRELMGREHDVYLLTSRTPEQIDTWVEPEGLKLLPLKSAQTFTRYPGFQLIAPMSFLSAYRQLKAVMPDVIHVHTPAFGGFYVAILAKLLKIPLVHTFHTFFHDISPYIWPLQKMNPKINRAIFDFVTRLQYNRAAVVVVPSEPVKKFLQDVGVTRPIEVIPNGVDLRVFSRVPIPRQPELQFLHVGRLGFEKNVDVVLKAFQKVLSEIPGAQLSIVGEGPAEASLKELAADLGIDTRVRFLGKLMHGTLKETYSGADVFVTASTIETEGLVLLEAMACGLPIVGVDRLAVPVVVRHRQEGLIARPFDPQDFANKMVQLAEDSQLREKMSAACIRRAQEFNLDLSVQKMEQLYLSLLAQTERLGYSQDRAFVSAG